MMTDPLVNDPDNVDVSVWINAVSVNKKIPTIICIDVHP